MPLSDYSHHNEDALAMWWAEEGSQHTYHEDDPLDEDDYFDDLNDYDEEEPDVDDDGEVILLPFPPDF